MHYSDKGYKADVFTGTNGETERHAQVGNHAEGSKTGDHWKSWKQILERVLPLPDGNGIENSTDSVGVQSCILEALSLPRAHDTSQVHIKFSRQYIEAREVSKTERQFSGLLG